MSWLDIFISHHLYSGIGTESLGTTRSLTSCKMNGAGRVNRIPVEVIIEIMIHHLVCSNCVFLLCAESILMRSDL